MSVYINGMEMPTEGEILCINIYPDGKVCIALDLDCKQVATAAPVPPHGRLIDADALEYHADNVRDPMGRTEKTVMWSKIQSAPTIIPAEEGGR